MTTSSLFREVFYQSRIPQVIITLDIQNYQYNYAFQDFLGYGPKEWDHVTIQDISHPDDYEKDLELLNILLSGRQKQYQMEKRYIHKSGHIKLGSLNVTLVEDKETGIEYILGQIFDLTEKNSIEKSLKESEHKYRLLAEHSSDMIVLHDVTGAYAYVSPSVKATMGYEPEEMYGKFPSLFFHPDDVPTAKKTYQRVLTHSDSEMITYRYLRKDGSYLWVETNLKAVFDEETGKLTGMISVSRDIQHRIETNDLLRKSEKLAVVGQMAAAVAHEIRNPLTPIKGFMQILSLGGTLNPAYTSIMLNEISRIETIITEFLSMAKPHNEKIEPIKVDEILKQVIELLLPQAMMKNKEIHYTINGEYPLILGDANSLKQVFLNVIQNGLDAIEEKGQVDVRLTNDAENLCIQIKDNGCGISKDRLSNIGEPFYSTKEKGTGLGLMTSYKIIENHKGRISIDSEEGTGTNVSIYLPMEKRNRPV